MYPDNTIRPCDVTAMTCRLLAVCSPDYLVAQGVGYEMLAVLVWRDMTWGDLMSSAEECFHRESGWWDAVAGCDTMFDDGMRALIRTMRAGGDGMDGPDWAKALVDDWHADGVYAYIDLIPVVEVE